MHWSFRRGVYVTLCLISHGLTPLFHSPMGHRLAKSTMVSCVLFSPSTYAVSVSSAFAVSILDIHRVVYLLWSMIMLASTRPNGFKKTY